MRFGLHRTVVFPIVLTKSTLNANEFYNSIKPIFEVPLHIIDGELYAKILKNKFGTIDINEILE